VAQHTVSRSESFPASRSSHMLAWQSSSARQEPLCIQRRMRVRFMILTLLSQVSWPEGTVVRPRKNSPSPQFPNLRMEMSLWCLPRRSGTSISAFCAGIHAVRVSGKDSKLVMVSHGAEAVWRANKRRISQISHSS